MTAGRRRPRDLGELRARKRELVERSAEQRESLALAFEGLAPAFAAGDRVAAAGRWLRAHPLLLAGAGVLFLVAFPRAVFAMAARGFALWKGTGAVRRLLG